MTALGAVVFESGDLCWPDEFKTPAVAQSSYQTCGPGGATHFQVYQTLIARYLTIEARQVSDGYLGYFTRAEVIAVKAMEGGPSVELNYEGRIFTVKILVTDFTARLDRPNPEPDDIYYGTISMREVQK